MKVVHISTVHPPFDQRIFYRECISLCKADYEVTLLAKHSKKNECHDGVNIISLGLPVKNRSRLRIVNRVYSILRALFSGLRLKAGIYHIHDPELILILPFLKLFSRARVIYDCHEDNIGFMHQKQHIPPYLRRLLSKIMGILELSAAHFADAVITADSGVEKRFQRMGARALTLYNFPRLDFFSFSNVEKKEYDLVYHGSIPRYHMEVCFAIDEALVRRGREVTWLFMGSYGDRIWMEKQVKLKSASHRFIFRNRIPHDKIADEVRKAKIGIIPLPDLPKFQHNIPTKLFEFMALEMSVVMSDLSPSRPFVSNGKCAIMVPPDDYEAYADKIIELLDDEHLRNGMGKRGRYMIESEYNWSTEADKLTGLYRSLFEML